MPDPADFGATPSNELENLDDVEKALVAAGYSIAEAQVIARTQRGDTTAPQGDETNNENNQPTQ